MSLLRGFEAEVALGTNVLKTRGDVTIEESYTEIEVKNAASEEVRYLRGMKSTSFQIIVQAGTDPDDASAFDGYSALYAHYIAGDTFPLTFTAPGGFTTTKNFIITNWTENDPVDDLASATITLRVSAASPTTSGTSSGGGSGSSSGT